MKRQQTDRLGEFRDAAKAGENLKTLVAELAEADAPTASCGQPPTRCELAYAMADGTGVPMRRKHLRGAKGRNGAAKTREVKAGSVFTGLKTSENEPHRNVGTTTYIATTDRREKFARQFRAEFDRRHPLPPRTTVFISDGAHWLESVHAGLFPFAVGILDFFHAVEHLRPLLLGLGIKEGSKEYRRRTSWRERPSSSRRRRTRSTSPTS